eukprot:scaffold19235_cov126-Isochrysis_galbana.AAC.7
MDFVGASLAAAGLVATTFAAGGAVDLVAVAFGSAPVVAAAATVKAAAVTAAATLCGSGFPTSVTRNALPSLEEVFPSCSAGAGAAGAAASSCGCRMGASRFVAVAAFFLPERVFMAGDSSCHARGAEPSAAAGESVRPAAQWG